ncbi:MAG: tetratricopeptide repeat protein [Thermoplasmatota archaeon]
MTRTDSMAEVQQLIDQGERLLNEFDYKGAHKKFKKALDKDKNARAHFGKAEAALGIPEIESEEIIADYEKAIELEENPFYHQAVASFCIDVGKFEKAEEHYREAAELDPENKPHYLSELAVGYRFKAPIMMEKLIQQTGQGEDIILRKSLNYMLEALDIDRDKAKELLG